MAHWISRLGFDIERLRFSLRTALAACLALLVAWYAGLEHPQWAAMTVFAASQPARNMLLEKGFFRAVGTLVGTIVGVLIVFVSGGEPAILVLGLAPWVGLCAWLGNLLRGFTAYGTLLAGYSAAMVALLDTAHPQHVLALGADRLLTVLTGVVTALLVGLIFAPASAEDPVVGRARRLSAGLLRHMAERLSGGGGLEDQHAMLREMAWIDEALEPHGAGSLRSRRSARTIRAILAAQVSALVWLRSWRRIPVAAEVGAELGAAARLLDASAPATEVIAALERAAERAVPHVALRDIILRIVTALRDRLGVSDSEARMPRLEQTVILHRDWVGARQATIRATGLMLLLGAIWVATGWTSGPYLLLGTAVMSTLFSTWDDPAWIMRQVLVGQVFGALGALACRWLVWPHATSDLELVFMLMPFVLVGVLPLSHRRTMFGATDYCMVLLLLSQPAFPLKGTFTGSLSMAAAVVAAPLIALIAFRFIFPADAHRRMRTLMRMMIHDLQGMAGAADTGKHQQVWRARFYHRLLRLVRWSDKTGESRHSSVDGALAVYAMGAAALKLREIRDEAMTPPDVARAIDAALGRIRKIASHPERTLKWGTRRRSGLCGEFRPARQPGVLQAGGALTLPCIPCDAEAPRAAPRGDAALADRCGPAGKSPAGISGPYIRPPAAWRCGPRRRRAGRLQRHPSAPPCRRARLPRG
ncbi:FUSC family protein [Mesorhizobium sp. ANAO-SY3R2]|uniref:FUSC family protein n=1 Tax=Mesorhizobium sp. ANAO-SY3R2 TaxID=3166644 RepID=UPI00366D363F